MKKLEGKLVADGAKIGIVAARFNEFIVSKLRSTKCSVLPYLYRTKPPPIRHPWLSGGLFEHRVQTLLDIYRTSSTSKFQTYVYLRKLILTNISPSQTRFINMILTRENGS